MPSGWRSTGPSSDRLTALLPASPSVGSRPRPLSGRLRCDRASRQSLSRGCPERNPASIGPACKGRTIPCPSLPALPWPGRRSVPEPSRATGLPGPHPTSACAATERLTPDRHSALPISATCPSPARPGGFGHPQVARRSTWQGRALPPTPGEDAPIARMPRAGSTRPWRVSRGRRR